MAGTQLAHILLSLGLLGVPWTVSWASQCPQKQEGVGEVVEGKALVGHVIKTLIAPSIFTCGHKCALTTGCASYNYGIESAPSAIRNVCQLNSETHKTKPLSLTIKPGYLYVAAKVCKPGFIGFDCKMWTGADGCSSGSPGKSCLQIRAHGHSRGNVKYWINPLGEGNPSQVYCDMTVDDVAGADGSSSSSPGKSCRHIRTLGHSRGNVKYWIDPLGEGNPFQVYCDMTVDGGGWTVIKEVNLTTTSPLTSEKHSNNYRDISEQPENQLISVPSLLRLQKVMGFSQLRFYCYMKSVNRTFHIMTKDNSLGAAVVTYYTADPKTQPQACDSFTRLPDDSSIVAQNCLKWGNKNGSTELNKWGHSTHIGSLRIYHHNAFWENHYYVGFRASYGYWCDDNKNATLSVGDRFGLYVR